MSIRWAAGAERGRDRSIEILGIIYGATKLWPRRGPRHLINRGVDIPNSGKRKGRAGKRRNIMTWTVFSTYLIMTRSLIMTRYHDTAPDQCIRPIGINPWPWEKMSWLSVFSIFVYYFNTPYHDSGSFSPNLSWVNLYEFSCQAAALCLGQPASLPDIRPASLPGIRPARRGR